MKITDTRVTKFMPSVDSIDIGTVFKGTFNGKSHYFLRCVDAVVLLSSWIVFVRVNGSLPIITDIDVPDQAELVIK